MNAKDVPVFILAGGLGTRLSEETQLRPKPMVEIGDIPILVHIMRYYYQFGHNDFVICAGYRSWDIKQFFMSYEHRLNHLEIDHREDINREAKALNRNEEQENWRVRVIDTGSSSMTGSRIAKAYDFISKTQKVENFAVTYGDGLADVDLKSELDFHKSHGDIGTVTGVKYVSRFGLLDVATSETRVQGFLEKPEVKSGYINGGFFMFRSAFREFLSTDESCVLERQPLERLAQQKQLMMFKHHGFWQPMDTLRDKIQLQEIWDKGNAPWARKKGGHA
jgi:glucose-1-phosphate cytidylyltransferase